jgi:hypothetical protein
MTKKALATIMVLGVIISVGYFAATPVRASDLNSNRETLITRISQKFNLNKSDVEALFDSIHDEHKAEMKAKMEARLAQAVKDGVITETQKSALITKMEEHQDGKKESREDFKKWLESQGIDPEKLKHYLGFEMRMHKGRMFRFIK